MDIMEMSLHVADVTTMRGFSFFRRDRDYRGDK